VLGAAVVQAEQAALWTGVSKFDLPLMYVEVDEQHRAWVLRANPAARRRWDNLDGALYRKLVESDSSATLPNDHPILQTWRTVQGVSRYYMYPGPGKDPSHAFLVCTPVTGSANEIRAVGVIFIDMNRSRQIFEAGTRFLSCETLESLYQSIVSAAKDLGFARVRLYRYAPESKKLHGVASAGMAET